MRIQITNPDKMLTEQYKIYRWSIHDVIEKKEYITGNKRSKVRLEYSAYYINWNSRPLKIRDTECKEIE